MSGQASHRIVMASRLDDPRLYQIDDDFRRVLSDVSFLSKMSRLTRKRFFHPKSTPTWGELTVLDHLAFPAHAFLTPGRRFTVLAKYSNATVADDLAPDIRGVALRLFEPGTGGPHAGLGDLMLNTGECVFTRTAATFQGYATRGAARDAVFENAPHLHAALWDVIRGPVSYADYAYYSQGPTCFVAADGTMWLVRFRLVGSDRHPGPGVYDPGDRRYPPDPPEYLPRDSGDTRAPTFLHDDLHARLAGPGVEQVLQLQLHPVTGTPADEIALDSSLTWPDECEWHDVAKLRLIGEADPELATAGPAFNPANAPQDLGIAIARTPYETASLNHLRALLYLMGTVARTGQQMPPELAALFTVESPAQISSPAPQRPVPSSPASVPAAVESPAARALAAVVARERPAGPRTVCVIGAGPAGLTAARELEQAGHRAVVLEARPTVGGKCESVQIEDRAFDLGGHLCTVTYERVAALAAELGVATEPTTQHLVYDTASRSATLQSSAFFRRETYQRYVALRAVKFPGIAGPGLAHSARALAAPAAQWLVLHGLGALAESLGTGYTAAGYGYLAGDLPALYFVKYAEMTGLLSSKPSLAGHAGSFTMAGGFVRLWEAVAKQLSDVRCGVRIDRIERDAAGVRVHTGDGVVEADDLVLTVPISQLQPLLDTTEAERDIAGRVRTLDYQTTIATVTGLPRSAFYLSRQATDPEMAATGARRCVSFHHRYPERDIYTCYSYGSYGDDRPADTDPVTRLAGDIERFGGRLDRVHVHREWAFLPHFGSVDLADGIYDRIEELQGQARTYHVGSLPAFELVECVVGYVQELIRQHFPPAAETGSAHPVLADPAVTWTGSEAAEGIQLTQAEPAKPQGQLPEPDVFGRTSFQEIREWLVKHIAVEARLPEAAVDPLRPLDDFALDSLSIAALQGELSDWLGFRVPHALFISVPTIDAMAAQLAADSAPGQVREMASRSVAPGLYPDGLLPLAHPRPFFCVAGAAGSPIYLRPLARTIGLVQGFCGLEIPGLHDHDQEPFEDISDLADHFLPLVRRVQARGPYLLGGHSFGGLVAYEMGRVLHERGERVHVTLLDSHLPMPGQLPPPQDESDCIAELFTMVRQTFGEKQSELGIPRDVPLEEQYELLAQAMGATGALPIANYLTNLIRVYQANLIATVTYRPPPSDMPITLFKASDGFPQVLFGDRTIVLDVEDPANGWNTADLPGLRTVTVPGNHFSMLAPPLADWLAIRLRDTFQAALIAAQ